jgi:hypothetical protein
LTTWVAPERGVDDGPADCADEDEDEDGGDDEEPDVPPFRSLTRVWDVVVTVLAALESVVPVLVPRAWGVFVTVPAALESVVPVLVPREFVAEAACCAVEPTEETPWPTDPGADRRPPAGPGRLPLPEVAEPRAEVAGPRTGFAAVLVGDAR